MSNFFKDIRDDYKQAVEKIISGAAFRNNDNSNSAGGIDPSEPGRQGGSTHIRDSNFYNDPSRFENNPNQMNDYKPPNTETQEQTPAEPKNKPKDIDAVVQDALDIILEGLDEDAKKRVMNAIYGIEGIDEPTLLDVPPPPTRPSQYKFTRYRGWRPGPKRNPNVNYTKT